MWKEQGETLSVLLDRVRKERGIGENEKITYAGRLDPMAEGVMMLLVGEACKQKDAYLGLSKVYECEVLFGVNTDTYDMLGIPEGYIQGIPTEESIDIAMQKIKTMALPYPPYSSKTVEGVPLFVHAKSGAHLPVRPAITGTITTYTCSSFKKYPLATLIDTAITIIQRVKGDFRQEEIVSAWKLFQSNYGNNEVAVATFTCSVTSGMYIRSIAHELGILLGTGALAYRITRTSLGKWTRHDCV